MRRCGGASRQEPRAPRHCNGRAIVRSIARRRLSSPALARRCDHAPKARSPGNAAMRWHPDIPHTALTTPPRSSARKLSPCVTLRLMALKPICFANPGESPFSKSSQSAGNRIITRLLTLDWQTPSASAPRRKLRCSGDSETNASVSMRRDYPRILDLIHMDYVSILKAFCVVNFLIILNAYSAWSWERSSFRVAPSSSRPTPTWLVYQGANVRRTHLCKTNARSRYTHRRYGDRSRKRPFFTQPSQTNRPSAVSYRPGRRQCRT
jgi:hypothetical protein